MPTGSALHGYSLGGGEHVPFGQNQSDVFAADPTQPRGLGYTDPSNDVSGALGSDRAAEPAAIAEVTGDQTETPERAWARHYGDIARGLLDKAEPGYDSNEIHQQAVVLTEAEYGPQPGRDQKMSTDTPEVDEGSDWVLVPVRDVEGKQSYAHEWRVPAIKRTMQPTDEPGTEGLRTIPVHERAPALALRAAHAGKAVLQDIAAEARDTWHPRSLVLGTYALALRTNSFLRGQHLSDDEIAQRIAGHIQWLQDDTFGARSQRWDERYAAHSAALVADRQQQLAEIGQADLELVGSLKAQAATLLNDIETTTAVVREKYGEDVDSAVLEHLATVYLNRVGRLQDSFAGHDDVFAAKRRAVIDGHSPQAIAKMAAAYAHEAARTDKAARIQAIKSRGPVKRLADMALRMVA